MIFATLVRVESSNSTTVSLHCLALRQCGVLDCSLNKAEMSLIWHESKFQMLVAFPTEMLWISNVEVFGLAHVRGEISMAITG